MLAKGISCYGPIILKKVHFGSNKIYLTIFNRCISTELTTALRPFYFAVHPDFFGQHPKERRINEDSLKQLISVLEALCEKKYHIINEKKNLQFYIRDAKSNSHHTFKLINITLDQRALRDPKAIVQHLLELCNLSTDYIKSIKSTIPKPTASIQTSTSKSKKDHRYNYEEYNNFQYNFYQTREEPKETLEDWIKENAALAKVRAAELVDLKEEIKKLQKVVVDRLGLLDARYECGWNYEHFRGCLKSLERLGKLHEKPMETLRGRIVVFAPFTGISRDGHVMLFTGDVLNNWIDFIRNIPTHDLFLQKIPLYENALSQVLRNIKVTHRKFMPKQQAAEYAKHLLKVTTTLGDYLTYNKYPESWPEKLHEYEIVIESEAGPLMVSPTGQLIAPATCPGIILIDFITTNLLTAKDRKTIYNKQKLIERDLVKKCKIILKLNTLTKDDSITPDRMINSLENLLKCNNAHVFSNLNLHITNFYSVLSDGSVCIPWDFYSK